MIALNQEQRLGEKAYLLMASRTMMPGVIMLLVSAILLSLEGWIVALVREALKASVAGPLSDIILALFIISLLVMLAGIAIARFEYANYTYTFEEFDLRMRRGVLHRAETSIPYRQIQDVDIDRTLIHQLMGLSKLTIITAGHEESAEHGKVEVVLEPVQKETAEEIRVMLERKIGVQVTKTVQEADREAAIPKDAAL